MAVLYILAEVPPDHVPGYLGWTLYWEALNDAQTMQVLASGNDRKTPGCVYHEQDRPFPAGCYVLKARRFCPYNRIPLASDHLTWQQTAPSDYIRGGGEGDILRPLWCL